MKNAFLIVGGKEKREETESSRIEGILADCRVMIEAPFFLIRLKNEWNLIM